MSKIVTSHRYPHICRYRRPTTKTQCHLHTYLYKATRYLSILTIFWFFCFFNILLLSRGKRREFRD
ncbi:hypothetical protein GIB67_032489 [Kingdonia uniflora]|uniref:Uncharacterized protein n=1 Tax=Kingdonia uniflora TaxID=39325 RepID=A0A7J7L7G2_9MAGN|nr:hypothetical protein GIB67_032489 [Kingdonia uniflora]